MAPHPTLPLPQVVLYLAVKLQGTLPALFAAHAGDEAEYVGGDGAVAAVIFIISGAAVGGNEAPLDGPLYAARHVVVEMLHHADGHEQRLVVAKQVAGAVGTVLVTRVDGGDDALRGGGVLPHLVAQALPAAGAVAVVAAEIALCLLLKKFYFIFHDILC